MKVLYLGHFKEGSGWSRAAIDYTMALDSAGVDVAIRSIDMNPKSGLTTRLVEMQEKSLHGITHVIYHILPELWEYTDKAKTVGLYILESDIVKGTPWEQAYMMADSLWSSRELPGLSYVPHPFNTNILKIKHKPGIIDKNFFNFYFIGEPIRRKDIPRLINAYMLAFDSRDQVRLTIKTSGNHQAIMHTINVCKKSMMKYRIEEYYPIINIVTENLPEEALYGIHKDADCFVTATRGEAWCYPCFDAMAFSNAVVAPKTRPFTSYLENYDGAYLFDTITEPMFGAEEFVKNLHTCHQTWETADIYSMAEQMRAVYDKGKDTYQSLYHDFTYEKVGLKMKELLC